MANRRLTNRRNDRWVEQSRSLLSRRKALGYLAAAGATVFLPGRTGHAQSSSSERPDSCSLIKSETGGPFEADGSNGPNVLDDPAVFRRDIRANLDGSNVQPGVPFILKMTVVDVANNCAPVVGAAVYLWHCNADGHYSAYSGMGQDDQTINSFLRGVQVTDANGQATFATIYPGRYPGRATHFHARVYSDESFRTTRRTTQFAFDDATNNRVYASSSQYQSSQSARETTNEEDWLFRDGVAGQLLALSGEPTDGYESTIIVGV